MTLIEQVNIGTNANDGTGDALRDAFDKVNQNIESLRSDLTTAPRAVLFGDSITKNNSDTGSNHNIYYGPRGYFAWLQVLLGWPFQFEVANDGAAGVIGDNAGIGGDRTDSMLARLESDVLSRSPDVVFFMGGTNDVAIGTDAATIIANIDAIITRLLRHNIIVIVLPILPRHPSGADWSNDSERRTHHAVNHWLRNKAKATHSMLMLDVYSTLVDEMSITGDARGDVLQTDGVHPNCIGAFHMAQAAKEQIASLLCHVPEVMQSPSDIFHATENPHGNMLLNGMLNGVSGNDSVGAIGDVADDWRVFRASNGTDATISTSKIPRHDGGAGTLQRLEITVSGSGNSKADVHLAPNSIVVTNGVEADAWYEGLCEVTVSASGNGLSPVNAVMLGISDDSDGGSRSRCFQPITGLKFPDVAWSGVLKTPTLKTVGADGIRFRVIINVDEMVADNVTIDIGRCTMRKLVTAPEF